MKKKVQIVGLQTNLKNFWDKITILMILKNLMILLKYGLIVVPLIVSFRKRKDLKWPADMYLEGSDQHRGWFHSSLLESCGTRGDSFQ